MSFLNRVMPKRRYHSLHLLVNVISLRLYRCSYLMVSRMSGWLPLRSWHADDLIMRRQITRNLPQAIKSNVAMQDGLVEVGVSHVPF